MSPPTKIARQKPQKKATISRKWKLRKADGLQILQSPQLSRLGWLVHGFSTRAGGSSKLEQIRDGKKSEANVMNLGFTEWDTRERVIANRKKFFGAVRSRKMRPVLLRQIHSDLVYQIGRAHV